MTAYSSILVEGLDNIAIIRLNDEKTLNAASRRMLSELASALAEATQTSRAILLTGAGRAFCSGINLQDGQKTDAVDYDTGAVLESHINPLMLQLKTLPVPLVVAVNGAAAGIGCSLALAGDFILAAENSYFLQAFQRIGLVPDGGSTFLLARSAGRVRAMEMILLGEKLPAARALDWGLINRVEPIEALLPAAIAVAKRLAAGPTRALSITRVMCWDALEMGFAEQLARERELQQLAGATADFQEGIAAFREKRPARFQGK
jgi:2-(1,2-epoxy-1,2-dihydrophenyl)acetyl-CoA isomerase